MKIVTVLKDGKIKGKYLVNIDNDEYFTNEATPIELVSCIKTGYEYRASKLKINDFHNSVYEIFWEDDDPKCEICKHKFEEKEEEVFSIAEFNRKTFRIPEKRWYLVEKNLSYYSEKENIR